MLIPKEKPYFDLLNSYYLKLDKFIEHLQKQIDSGGIHCRSRSHEMMIYFNRYEIIRGYSQKKDQPVSKATELDAILRDFRQESFEVQVFGLDLNAVYFWGQLPPYEWTSRRFRLRDITVEAVVRRHTEIRFSGFLDIGFKDRTGGLLFFDKGQMIGGSYTWGHGGLSPWEKDYQRLIDLAGANDGLLSIGTYLPQGQAPASGSPPIVTTEFPA